MFTHREMSLILCIAITCCTTAYLYGVHRAPIYVSSTIGPDSRVRLKCEAD